jgi:aryl-alcohol dehydrogenase-like predicted oxidoreductase
MKHRYLGKEKLEVSAVGYGCPPFVGKLSDEGEKKAIAVIHCAIDLGVNFIDTADHNDGNNEEILAKALKGRRNSVVLASKFGNLRGQPWAKGRLVDGKPEYVPLACEASLQRLKTDVVDLYYLHRVDPQVPIEETVGAMARLREQGKIRFIGLCEAGPETIRRANSVHPITAVQSEYSLWTRDYEADTIPVVRELGIGFVSYYSLGRGFFSESINSLSQFAPKDARRRAPRFYDENLEHNLKLLAQLKEVADAKGRSCAQLSLAWILHQGDFFVPIPGTSNVSHLEENTGASVVDLTSDDLAKIGAIFPQKGSAAGDRFDRDRSSELNI